MEQEPMKRSQHEGEIIIKTGDRLTIETIADFIDRIRKGLAEATTVAIAFEPELEMDITALQVFCSACKTAASQGKNFIHRGSPPKALLELSAAAGAERNEQCSINSNFCFRRFGGVKEWEK